MYVGCRNALIEGWQGLAASKSAKDNFGKQL